MTSALPELPDGWEVQYPATARWLSGTHPDHPSRWLLHRVGKDPMRLARTQEEILSTLDAANPNRLGRKRRDFRHDLSGWLNLRIELVVGYALVRAGLQFEFGDEGQPDIHVLGADAPIAIELTSRDLDDLHRLWDEIDLAIRGLGVEVNVRLPRRLKIPAVDRQAIVERIGAAARKWTQEPYETPLALPEVEGSASFAPAPFDGLSHLSYEIGPELEQHMADVAQWVRWVVDLKAKQAIKGHHRRDTILLVDAGRLGGSWLVPQRTWGERIRRLDLPWESLPFLGVGVVYTNLSQPTVLGGCALRPDLTPEQTTAVEMVLTALSIGLPAEVS